jgi:hypothetical protein
MMFTEVTMKCKNNYNAVSRAAFDVWRSKAGELCRLGGFATHLEGFRVHFNQMYLDHMEPFEHQDWIAWPTGKRCSKLAPACATELFWEDRKRLESRLGADTAGSICGDLPVTVRFLTRARINLPAQITELPGIHKNDRVYVMPRLIGYMEIWNNDRWLTAVAKGWQSDSEA